MVEAVLILTIILVIKAILKLDFTMIVYCAFSFGGGVLIAVFLN